MWSLLSVAICSPPSSSPTLYVFHTADSDCGQRPTVNHIVDTCPLTKSAGGLNLLHEADNDAVMWRESTVTAALAK